jgi:N-acetylneuraminic acid mutarotase
VGCRGKVYVVGGRGAGQVSACSSIAWYHVDTVWCYDPEDDSWSKRAPFPAGPTSSLTVTSIGSKVYAVGGDQEGGTFLSSSYEYDTEDDVWRQLPSLPEEVAHPCLGAVGKVLYVAGGWPAGTNEATGRSFKLGLEEEKAGWVELDPLPVPVFVAGSAVVGREFFVPGGASGYGGHAIFETQVITTACPHGTEARWRVAASSHAQD